MGSGSLHGRQILDWSGKTAGAPGHRALTLPSGGKEEMAPGATGRKWTVGAVPGAQGRTSHPRWEPVRQVTSQKGHPVTPHGCLSGGVSSASGADGALLMRGRLAISHRQESGVL